MRCVSTHPLIHSSQHSLWVTWWYVPPCMHESVNMTEQSCDSSGIQNLSRIIFDPLIILNLILIILLGWWLSRRPPGGSVFPCWESQASQPSHPRIHHCTLHTAHWDALHNSKMHTAMCCASACRCPTAQYIASLTARCTLHTEMQYTIVRCELHSWDSMCCAIASGCTIAQLIASITARCTLRWIALF